MSTHAGAVVEHSGHQLRPASASHELKAGRGTRRQRRREVQTGPKRLSQAFLQGHMLFLSSPSCRLSIPDLYLSPHPFISHSYVSSIQTEHVPPHVSIMWGVAGQGPREAGHSEWPPREVTREKHWKVPPYWAGCLQWPEILLSISFICSLKSDI